MGTRRTFPNIVEYMLQHVRVCVLEKDRKLWQIYSEDVHPPPSKITQNQI